MTSLWAMYFELSTIDSVVESRSPSFFVDMESYSFVGIEWERLCETVGGGSFVCE